MLAIPPLSWCPGSIPGAAELAPGRPDGTSGVWFVLHGVAGAVKDLMASYKQTRKKRV